MKNGLEVRSDTLSKPRDAEPQRTETLGSQEFEPAASHPLQVIWAAGAAAGSKVQGVQGYLAHKKLPRPHTQQQPNRHSTQVETNTVARSGKDPRTT